MKYKVGDRVKFLDQKGGGTVSKIVSSQIVNVTDEDGFDIPTLIKDIVKIDESASASAKMFQEIPTGKETTVHEEIRIETAQESDNYITPLKMGFNSQQAAEGIYLAFVPHEQQWLLMGDIDIYVINHTDRDAFYNLFLHSENGYEGIDYNMIPPHSKSFVETINRDELNQWLQGVIQVLFHGDCFDEVPTPISAPFKIQGDKFFKESSFVFTPIMNDKTFLVKVTSFLKKN